jgi:uncharacterized membrane protein YgcG
VNSLHEALQECLAAVDSGQRLETVLARYPDQASELRQMLEAAQAARAEAAFEIPDSLHGRSRVRVLRRATEIRAAKAARRQRLIGPLPRMAISLALVVVLVLTSTRLVSASSGALPGDQLYSVKRSWEDVQLFFVFQEGEHQLLESQFTQERLDETSRLLGQGRAVPISFSGLVMHQQDGTWLVSGIRISITANTLMPSRPIGASEPVTITGITRSDGTVVAEQVQLLQPGVALPPLEPTGNEAEATDGGAPANGEQSGASSPGGQPGTTATGGQPFNSTTPAPSYQFSGIVGAMQGTAWIINGQPVYLDQAQITGTVKVGAIVTFQGYYSANGRFEVTQLNVNWSPRVRSGASQDTGNGSGSSGTGNSGGDNSGGDKGSEDGGEGH